MSKHWITILLIVSLAFNLAVLGSFLFLQFRHHHPHRDRDLRYSRPHEEFGPRDERWIPLQSDSTRVLRENFIQAKRELMQELAKDPLNEANINEIIERSISAQTLLERDLGLHLIEVRRSMSAEEAREHFTRRLENIQPRNDRRKRK